MTTHTVQQRKLKAEQLPVRRGSAIFIVPDGGMTIEGLQTLHSEFDNRKFLILDNNPFSRVSREEALKFLLANRSWLRVVDHHGHFGDDTKQATFPRLIKQIPELERDGFLSTDAACFTNSQNLDPDALLSFYAVTHHMEATAASQLLSLTANYSDFALFGEERFDQSLQFKQLENYQHLCFAILQLITDEKGRFVERVTGKKLLELDADSIRGVFVDAKDGTPSIFNQYAVHNIYLRIVNQWFRHLLENYHSRKEPTALTLSLSARAFERLRVIHDRALEVTEVIGVDDQHPSGKIALMAENTGFSKRLDHDFLIYDWLMESAGQYCFDAPIHVRLYRDMLVISVRFPRHGELRSATFNMIPLMRRLNEALGDIGEPQSLYGRQEVVLGKINSRKLPIDRIVKLLLEQWPAIESSLRKAAQD